MVRWKPHGTMLDGATGEVINGETLHRYRCLSVETVPYDLDRV